MGVEIEAVDIGMGVFNRFAQNLQTVRRDGIIAVHKEHILTPGCLQTGISGTAKALILLMDNLDSGILPRILIAASLGTIPPTLLLAGLHAEQFPSPALLFVTLTALLFLCGIGIAPYWPTLQVYGVARLPEADPTLLYIYFSAVGVPGCGFFTWMIGVLGDRWRLQGALLLIPATLVIYVAIIGWDLILRRKKHE